MSDPVYSFTNNPSYHEEIRKIQNTDPVNAETIVNPLIEKMLENTHFVKKQADGLETRFMQTIGLKEIAFTIPPDAWNQNGAGRYPFTAVVAIEEIKETHLPDIYFDEVGQTVAYTCGVSQQVQTLDGRLRFSSQTAPDTAISGTCRLWTPGVGGGSAALPVATADQIGGIKASDSILIDEDGTAHAVTRLTEENFVSDEEIQAMLNEVYRG